MKTTSYLDALLAYNKKTAELVVTLVIEAASPHNSTKFIPSFERFLTIQDDYRYTSYNIIDFMLDWSWSSIPDMSAELGREDHNFCVYCENNNLHFNSTAEQIYSEFVNYYYDNILKV